MKLPRPHMKFSLPLLAIIVLVLTGVGYFVVSSLRAANADINGDGHVNATDLSILASNYGKTGQSFAQGDINGDSTVNILDLSVLATNWGATTAGCTGVTMTAGQSDIDSHGTNTVFCLSGTHNWNLTPKSGDQFIGPAILDGGGTTDFAFEPGTASNVVIADLEIRNYTTAKQLGAILSDGTATGNPGWVLRNLQVHDIGSSAGGAGVGVGPGWQIIGGRYYNNRQEGLTNFRGNGAVVDGVELDHNNFTDDSYTTRNIDCGDEAGGYKWFANNVTVKNSKIHDNACVGLWSDGNAQNSTLTNNQIYNNWNEGIFIEISVGSTITGNTVYGNGQKGGGGSNSFGCNHWMYGAGITIAHSGSVEVANNNVYGNCNGITGTQEPRPDGVPGLLQNLYVHDNTIAGPGGLTGVSSFPTVDLTNRNIVFTNNTYLNGMNFCGFTCNP